MFCCAVVSVFSIFYNHLDREERAGCLNLTVFLISCDCKCAVAIPHDAVGWSAVCDVVISDHTQLLF